MGIAGSRAHHRMLLTKKHDHHTAATLTWGMSHDSRSHRPSNWPVCMGFWRITAVWDGANKIVGSHWCCLGESWACFAKHKYKHHVVIQQRLSVFASMLASWRHKFYRAGAVSAAQTQPMEEETGLEIKFPHQWFILYAVGSCLYRGTSFLLRAKLFLNLSLSNPYFEIWRKCSSKKPVESALAPQA